MGQNLLYRHASDSPQGDRAAPRVLRRLRLGRRALSVERLECRLPLSLFHPTVEVPSDTATVEGSEIQLTSIFRDADPADTYTASIDWGDGTTSQVGTTASPAFNTPLSVRIDYSQDFNNFFDTQQKRDLLQLAADTLVSRFSDTLLAIRPNNDNTWEAIFTHPATGLEASLPNLTIEGNEILVFAGGRELESPSLGSGGFGGFNAIGSEGFLATVRARGESGALEEGNETDIGPWGGSISFSTRSSVRWHFGDTTDGLQPGETDFLTVAMHEMAHLFGFGTAKSWQNQVNEIQGVFTGSASIAEYDEAGSPPLNNSRDHWADGTEDGGTETAMDPTIASNRRKLFTPLDFAALDDIGWNLIPGRQGNVNGSHTYADDGVYTITVTVTDNTGRSGSESFDVTVNNLAPVITPTGTQTIHAGDVLNITNIATFTDAGFNNALGSPPTTETFDYTINWGDGSQVQAGSATVDSLGGPGAPTTGSFNGSHTFASDGVFEVVVSIQDDDGGFDLDSFSVIVFAAVEAVIDEYSTDKVTPLIESAPGVLDNDNGDLLRVTAVNGNQSLVGESFILASGATVTLHQDGRLDYDPTTSSTLQQLDAGQSALETFTYTISDGREAFDMATVRIEVAGLGGGSVLASLDARVVTAPTITQEHDQVATLPDNELWIHEWRPFAVEIWVRVTGQGATGVASVATQLEYNTDYFSVVEVIAGSAFASDFSSTITESSGRVDISGVSTVTSPVGTSQFVLLASVAFEASDDDSGVPIGLNQPGPVQPIVETWINLGDPSTVMLTGGVPVNQIDQSDPTTELWPLLYDLDDDGRIGFGDLSIFSSVFLAAANQSPIAAKSDFDVSGSVTFGDLAFFSTNFLANRTGGESISFPDNFPSAFQSSSAFASSAPSPMALALAADEVGSESVMNRDVAEPDIRYEEFAKRMMEPTDGTVLHDSILLATTVVPTATLTDSFASIERIEQVDIVFDAPVLGDLFRSEAAAATGEAFAVQDDADTAAAVVEPFDVSLSLLDDLYTELGYDDSE